MALTAAVLSGMVTMNESPTDTEPALNPSSAAVGALLALVAVVAAVRASATISRVRAALAVPVAAAAAGTPFLVRYTWPYPDDSRFNSIMAFTVALVLAVVVLSGPRPRSLRDWLHYPAAFAVTAVGLPW
ncbi:hypothetical protein AB0M36_33400 [Actinoplanes sp. NPDC051346]|uniref:hypothetical protein n=1 Tax=Actinoplanes sp. NPDC051346 TaxID=3155048 RepID=UPI003417665F